MLLFEPPKSAVIKEKDLFSNPNKITASWLGFLQSGKEGKYISNVPMLIYNDLKLGSAKIICIPKSPDEWNAKFRGKSKLQKASITKTLLSGIINRQIGEKYFKIYALFQLLNNKKYGTVKNSTQAFPSTVQIYLNKGDTWRKIDQKKVLNVLEWQRLQYHLASVSINKS
ncbi:hypothetical protein GCM10008119_36060 [Pedobacter mendelii]|uniref:Uncharacterized protein n=1 Tax=Pedobacter mendelii TaxID=1908240 RepID=A0ABQ2BLN5_9SPHI|nr:hypothetical protein GCM10008119_36060 [Pedobacter mendelii]